MRKIIHIDMDAFFASVEQRDHPEYRGRPIAVGGSPEGRGVLATASYEARTYGLRSAMPAAKALRLCPHVIFVKPRMDVYRAVSKQIHQIFRTFTDVIEPLSLDEAYLDVTQNKHNQPSATYVAQAIKAHIYKTTQLTASAGVSYNKFLAKIASDLDKPNGLSVIPPEKAQAFIDQLPVHKLQGVGQATEAKMKKMGIHTGADLKHYGQTALMQVFGHKAGYRYDQIAHGIDTRPVKTERTRKSIGKETTFATNCQSVQTLQQELQQMADHIAMRAHKADIQGKTITLKIRYPNFETHTHQVTLDQPTNQAAHLYHYACQLLNALNPTDVRLIGMNLSNLITPKDQASYQFRLFND